MGFLVDRGTAQVKTCCRPIQIEVIETWQATSYRRL